MKLCVFDVDGEVPKSELVVGRSNSKNRLFTGLKLNGSDCRGVPADLGDRVDFLVFVCSGVNHSEVPDFELTLVIS